MRSNLELWKIIRDNFDRFWDYNKGLCYVILVLWGRNIINDYENSKLSDELNEYGDSGSYFLGKKGDPKPRKEFIEKMIKKQTSWQKHYSQTC